VIFNTVERMVAFRYLRARRQEGFVSVIAIFSLLGIALGVATLIIVMAVMNGFRTELVGRILGLNGHLAVYGEGVSLSDFDTAAAKVRQVPGVLSATPLVEGQVMATSPAGAAGALVRGIRPADIRARQLIVDHIVAGSLAQFGDDGVAIGDRLARRLGLDVGGKVTLIAPEGTDTAFGTVPRLKTYRIAALFDVGYYEYDNSFIYIPLEAAQVFFRLPNAISYLEVFVSDADQSSADAHLVATAGRDIAILRTMGASRGMVLRIFMLSGSSIGVVGTLFGFGLGVLITRNLEAIREFLQNILQVKLFAAEIYFFTRIPARIEPGEVATVVIMALALSFLATLYPSWRAARLDPVEGLRYE
jgi:lipoprotein-releasing system permease protein